jgi:hypothetical protein
MEVPGGAQIRRFREARVHGSAESAQGRARFLKGARMEVERNLQ